MSKKATNDALRNQYVEAVMKMLADAGEDVLRVGSNEIAIPVVDAEGEDNYVVFVVKVPTGSRDGDAYDTKYPYVCHAELNAILNCRGVNLEGCRIYVALFPCNECAKAIIQSGIKEVVYLSDKYANTMGTRASKRMFTAAGVKMTKLNPQKDSVLIDFDEKKI